MFKRKKYTISFEKSYQLMKYSNLTKVTDAHILHTLLNIQDKYDFEIISIKLKDALYRSKIVIKCDKEYKNKIFIDFCIKLSGQIEKIKI